ncbi:uncharacterized protein BO88DRAFT_81687 [Aspergillus vadensis CBS 113365]|uniref:Uncharacterized protein n=1 Tax=Aspergillus vadensis (strain CBS 113365 / IMI 142717 / IBT 24658) TaxID=1448311 RepID=A0A319BNT1_ASPVC|nr:hypothetical protein BO88DRAFT_81687 [Aspergillus vadensis CBS 113365]PYH67383.1 hypothetical protein BO88DRAFT_81687 [Aspergillus vadensis CBS 113365]
MTGCLPNQAARCEVLRPLLHFTRNRNLTSSRLCSSYAFASLSLLLLLLLLLSPGYPVVSLRPSPVSSGARSSHLSLPLSAPLPPPPPSPARVDRFAGVTVFIIRPVGHLRLSEQRP